jgi:hypothetical protein
MSSKTSKKSISSEFRPAVEFVVEPNPSGIGASVTMPGASFSSGSAKASTDASPAASAARAKSDGKGSERYARWDWKNDILNKIEKEPMASSAIENKAFALLGQGIGYVRNADLAAGTPKRYYDPEIESILRKNAIETDFLQAQAFDIAGLYNNFSQAVFNISRTKILQLKHLEAEYSAVSKFNVTKGTLDRKNLFYSGEFSRQMSDVILDDPSKTTVFELFDPLDWNFFPNMVKKKAASFAIQNRIKVSRSFFYATPIHLGLFRAKGWVDNNIIVPEVVHAMSVNQISLKYMIYISIEYFEALYGKAEWMKFTEDVKKDKFEKLRKEIQDKLVGTDNLFSSLTLMCDRDFSTGALRKTIIIEAIDDKVKTDSWVPNSDHGNQNIIRGFNVPTSMYGLSNSNVRMNTQSGSANREGFNNMVTLNTPVQKLLLAPLQIMADFNAANGWSNWDVTFFIDDVTHTSINNQESGIQKSDNPIITPQ